MPDVVQAKLSLCVSCRPTNVAAVCVGIPGLFAVLLGLNAWAMAVTPGLGSRAMSVVFTVLSLLCFLGAVAGLRWTRRAQVTADGAGLRWRGLGRWRSARWDEVSDYFDKLPPRGASVVSSVIQTRQGPVRFSSKWSDRDALRAAVVERAGRLMGAGWETQGCRASDPWPRVFGYDTFNNRWMPTLTLKLFLAFVAYLLVKPALGLAALGGLVGWRMALITAGLYALLIIPLGLLFLLPLAQYREVRRRRGQTITVDPNGLVFQAGDRAVAAAWPDVTGYFVGRDRLNPLYVVETRHGNFEFLAAVGRAGLLQAIIRQWATRATEREWEPRRERNTFGAETAHWCAGQNGKGARRYHYQTRSNRAFLWGPPAFGLAGLLLAELAGQGVLPGADWRLCAAGALFWFVVLAVGWQVYRSYAILADDVGLTQTTMLGRRFLPWPQVRDYFLLTWSGTEAGGVVVGRDCQITFSAGIVGREELQAEIQRRSTECGGKEWEMRGKIQRGRTGGAGG